MQLMTLAVLGAVAACLAVIHFIKAFRELNSARHPPGPMQIPVLGRIHDLPILFMWKTFKAWSDKYGEGRGFFRTTMLGHNLIVVTDEKVAEDLLVRRAKINSDRPEIRSLLDPKVSKEYLPLMGRNQYWARQRKMVHAYLTESANADYNGVMTFEAKRWLAQLAANPSNFHSSLKDMASRIMCTLAWDDTTHSEGLTAVGGGLLWAMSPAGPISNVLTPLWKLPLALNPWKRREMVRHANQQRFWMERMVEVRHAMARGETRPCWTRQFLERYQAKAGAGLGGIQDDHEASSMLGMLATVGVFTVSSPLLNFLVAMVHNPRWQAAVQKEVDEACGGRMPELADMPNLPVLRACIKETLRWRPSVPTGVAHQAEADQVYNGYVIPKGTSILPLDYGICRNPVKYPDPESYRPERWLEPEWPTFQLPLTVHPSIKGMTGFGWGQRQCLGMSLMQDELVVACGALAWAYKLKASRDPVTGLEVLPSADRTNSLLIVELDPFEMVFEARSDERKEEVLRGWEEAEARELATKNAFLEAARRAKCVDNEKLKDAVLVDVVAVDP